MTDNSNSISRDGMTLMYDLTGPWNLTWPDEVVKRWHNLRGMAWGRTFDGQDPLTVSRFEPSYVLNLTVHLANEHGLKAHELYGAAITHSTAHEYGTFREGQGHYHSKPGQSFILGKEVPDA